MPIMYNWFIIIYLELRYDYSLINDMFDSFVSKIHFIAFGLKCLKSSAVHRAFLNEPWKRDFRNIRHVQMLAEVKNQVKYAFRTPSDVE